MIKKKRERKPYVVARQCGERPARKCVCVPSHKHIYYCTQNRDSTMDPDVPLKYIILLYNYAHCRRRFTQRCAQYQILSHCCRRRHYIGIRAAINQKLVQLSRIVYVSRFTRNLCDLCVGGG